MATRPSAASDSGPAFDAEANRRCHPMSALDGALAWIGRGACEASLTVSPCLVYAKQAFTGTFYALHAATPTRQAARSVCHRFRRSPTPANLREVFDERSNGLLGPTHPTIRDLATTWVEPAFDALVPSRLADRDQLQNTPQAEQLSERRARMPRGTVCGSGVLLFCRRRNPRPRVSHRLHQLHPVKRDAHRTLLQRGRHGRT